MMLRWWPPTPLPLLCLQRAFNSLNASSNQASPADDFAMLAASAERPPESTCPLSPRTASPPPSAPTPIPFIHHSALYALAPESVTEPSPPAPFQPDDQATRISVSGWHRQASDCGADADADGPGGSDNGGAPAQPTAVQDAAMLLAAASNMALVRPGCTKPECLPASACTAGACHAGRDGSGHSSGRPPRRTSSWAGVTRGGDQGSASSTKHLQALLHQAMGGGGTDSTGAQHSGWEPSSGSSSRSDAASSARTALYPPLPQGEHSIRATPERSTQRVWGSRGHSNTRTRVIFSSPVHSPASAPAPMTSVFGDTTPRQASSPSPGASNGGSLPECSGLPNLARVHAPLPHPHPSQRVAQEDTREGHSRGASEGMGGEWAGRHPCKGMGRILCLVSLWPGAQVPSLIEALCLR